MADIHPTAIVESGARLGEGAVVGPFSIVGEGVELGAGVRLVSHAVVTGRTTVGEGTVIYPFASIGHRPQDMKYRGEPSALVIGRRNTIREHVTMNPGTAGGGMATVVGDDCLFMAGAHVAHDCRIGSNVIFANHATLGGHVEVHDNAILGGLVGVHQFVRIGEHAMVGGLSGVEHDVVPFGLVIGNRARLLGLNLIGLRRRQFPREEIEALRRAYQILFDTGGTVAERLELLSARLSESRAVRRLAEFIAVDSSRPLCRPANGDAV